MVWMSFLYGKDKIKGYVACFFKKSGISEWYGAVYKQHRHLHSFVVRLALAVSIKPMSEPDRAS